MACSEATFWNSPEKDSAILSGHSACKTQISLKQIIGVTWGSPDISSFFTPQIFRLGGLLKDFRNVRDLDSLLFDIDNQLDATITVY